MKKKNSTAQFSVPSISQVTPFNGIRSKRYLMSWVITPLLFSLFLFAGWNFFFPWDVLPAVFPDSWVSLWSLYWCALFLQGKLSSLYYSFDIFAPQGTSLLLHNLTEGIFLPGALLTLIFSVEKAYYLLCFALLLLNGLSVYYLVHYLSKSSSTAFLCGLLFSLHPYVIGHLEGGHINLIALFPLPLLLLCIFTSPQHLSLRYIGYITALVLFSAFTDYYLFALSLFLTTGAVFYYGTQRNLGKIYIIGAGTIVGFLLSLPKILPALLLSHSHLYTKHHDPSKNSLDLCSLLFPSWFQWSHSFLEKMFHINSKITLNWAESGGHLGLAMTFLLLLSYTSYKKNKKAAYLGLSVAIVSIIALGPSPCLLESPIFSSKILSIFHHQFPLALPVPARYMALAIVLLCGTVGVLARSRPLTVKLLLLLSLIESFPQDLPSTPIPPYSATLEQARNLDKTLTILDLGSPQESMYRQIYHGHPLVGGFLARTPLTSLRAFKRNGFLRWVNEGIASKKELAQEYHLLSAQVVLASTSNLESISRLQQLPFLELAFKDEYFVLFIDKTIKHEVKDFLFRSVL